MYGYTRYFRSRARICCVVSVPSQPAEYMATYTSPIFSFSTTALAIPFEVLTINVRIPRWQIRFPSKKLHGISAIHLQQCKRALSSAHRMALYRLAQTLMKVGPLPSPWDSSPRSLQDHDLPPVLSCMAQQKTKTTKRCCCLSEGKGKRETNKEGHIPTPLCFGIHLL
jgi:hypothetical protein